MSILTAITFAKNTNFIHQCESDQRLAFEKYIEQADEEIALWAEANTSKESAAKANEAWKSYETDDQKYGLYLNAIRKEKLVGLIHDYQSLRLDVVDNETLNNTLGKLLKFQITKNQVLTEGYEFYRVRKWDGNQLFKEKSHLFCREHEQVTTSGRLNDVGESYYTCP